nr:DeoR/GlpR family DNA-binding transcription regulator [uncultured Duganella sp.]
MNPILPLERRAAIAQRLADGHTVSAALLAAEFAVSEDAVRRDLRALAAEGLCQRIYGGALPSTPAAQPLAVRKQAAQLQKRALARAAAATVLPGQLVFLDCGSTNLPIVEFLGGELTVATNSIDIAAAVLKRPDLRLILVGGVVTPALGGSVDAAAIATVSNMNIERLFLGACAIDASTGVSAFDPADAQFKRALVAASAHVTVLATSEKLGTSAPFRVAHLNGVSTFIVEHDVPDAALRPLLEADAVVAKAAPPEPA